MIIMLWRTEGAPFGEDSDSKGPQELDLSHDAVAASVATLPTAALPDGELIEQHRILAFQDFCVWRPTGYCSSHKTECSQCMWAVPVMRVLVMWECTPDSPSQCGPAPPPPAMVS